MTTTDVEFVNDWQPLQEAVNVLLQEDIMDYDYCECEVPCPGGHSYINYRVNDAIEVVTKYVPTLIEQYSKLLELSFVITDAWDRANQNKTPSGLEVVEFKL